ncbi:chemotaxis protein CheW [Sanguibacter suaedae]|jgi:purine-binding chemotaxis protein CheW|uniref:Chemotaxis protein CheW n=1 Tax=Sanguibacter suaedae TaxID=2795737 RepID=A0A934ICW5_9MICO|nr:chemotaxis protein CheW [Sanguibacter suaedae]MBI9114594.1 chemotaxis protein CheW [Sanguibacter suaedae]
MSTQYVTFRIGEALYGVEVMRISETLGHHPRTPVPLAPAGIAGLVNLRGQVVMTVDLRPRLGLEPLDPHAESMMVVVEIEDDSISLLVDEVGEVLMLDDDQFETPPDTLSPGARELITGAFKLESGLLLTLDVDAALAA